MSADTVTEVTSQSWFSRIGGAIKGIIVGILLFVVAFPLLFWNEGRAVKRYKTLKEGSGIVVSVPPDTIDVAHEGKLVHMTGRAETDVILKDSTFNVSAKALKLARRVEMYQWQQSESSSTKKKLGGGTETKKTYSYTKGWSQRLINSSSFKEPSGHQNPAGMPFESEEQLASPVTLGAFVLSESLVDRVNNYSDLIIEPAATVPARLTKAKIYGGGFYMGGDPASPKVGDVRVRFSVANPTDVSLVAQQKQNSFEPYKTEVGGTIELLQTGTATADEMFQSAQDSNKMLTWIIRLGGFLLMLIGLNMIFRLLSVLADVLPFLGNIIGAGVGIITFLVAAVLSLITIAIAWIVFRPLLGIGLLIVAGALIFAVRSKMKKGKPAAVAEAA